MKKLLTVMMLCVCVFGLAGCNKFEEKPKTLEVGFKKELKEEFESYSNDFIKSSHGVVTEIDIVDNEVLVISESKNYEALYEIIRDNEDAQKKVEDYLDLETMGYILIPVIEEINGFVEDYEGDTILTYIYRIPSGEEVVKFSVDKDGLIK